MAEAIPFSIVTTLITKLGAVAFNEISLVYGVEDDLGKLKDTLSTIEAALLDADQMKAKSHLMQDWIKKLNDAVYDADDLLDAFATKALQRELSTDGRINMKVRDFFSSSNPLAFSSKMGHKIKEMRERFDEIAANMSKFNFTERLFVQASVDNNVRETDSFVLASEITGRDKDKEEIIKLIMCSSNKQENVSVIPIIGIGGLGKTALTQLVYGDERVVKYFKLKLCQDDGDILPILKLSYDQLPIQLRQCFAYCSIFPKDYEIQKEVLIQLWMAQGYVQSSNNIECLEAIGDQYFRNLSSRSFFQDAKVNDDNEVTSCKMHDLIHDLATRVAGSDCAIAETYVDNISNRVHHVSIAYPFEELPRQILKAKGLRTFLPTCDHDDYWNSKKVSITRALMSPNFTCLRVLDVHSCGVQEVPSSVGKLQHLRYFDLSKSRMTSLPNSIRKLVNLQTLKLSDCYHLKKLPEGITKLINLRYLVTDGCWSLKFMPTGMGKLTSLRRLNKFVVGLGGNKWGLQLSELNGLNKLEGDISIEGLGNVKDVRWEAKEANLMARQYLHSLTLKWGGGFDRDMDEILLEGLQPHPKLRELSIWGYPGEMFPSWMRTGNIVNSLPNIVRITLEYCERCEHLPQSLDQLPFLKSLTLIELKRVEHINDDDENSNNERMVERKSSTSSSTEGEGMSVFFPSLEELFIYHLPNLKGWWRGEEREESSVQRPSFPRLTTLKIINCPEFTSMPIHSSHHLEELYLNNVPEKLVRQLLLLTTSATTSSSITITEGGSASSSSSSSISSLSKLKSLSIWNIESLPEEEVLWKNLSSLDRLKIGYIQKLVSLPVGLQQLTTLQELRIYGCDGLMALPDWLSNLTSLQELYIYECPLLSERCQKETGQDWSNISHIPTITID